MPRLASRLLGEIDFAMFLEAKAQPRSVDDLTAAVRFVRMPFPNTREQMDKPAGRRY